MPDDEWEPYDTEFDYTGGPDDPDNWQDYSEED